MTVPGTKGRQPARERRKKPLRGCMHTALERYFKDMDGHNPGAVYSMVIGEVEQAMLEIVMNHAGGNQSRAAEILGINRTTLRKKLRLYGIAQ